MAQPVSQPAVYANGLIWSPQKYLVKNINYKATRCVVFRRLSYHFMSTLTWKILGPYSYLASGRWCFKPFQVNMLILRIKLPLRCITWRHLGVEIQLHSFWTKAHMEVGGQPQA
jgi:hypothetical protein